MSPKCKKLKAALEANGYTDVKVWWEQMGIALEMCGNSGGYVFDSEQEGDVPIGLSFDEAMEAVTKLYTREHLRLNGLLPESETEMSDDQEKRADYRAAGVRSATHRPKGAQSKYASLTTWGPSRRKKKRSAVGKSGG